LSLQFGIHTHLPFTHWLPAGQLHIPPHPSDPQNPGLHDGVQQWCFESQT
jgi:hypothetical protein